MARHIVVYMSPWCHTSQDTQRAFSEWGIPATFINIKEDRSAAARLKGWVGFESVPTVVLVEGDSVEPFAPPVPLPAGSSPRGLDRGSMITEATRSQLQAWLVKNEMLSK